MWRKIHSNRDPRDTLYSEIRKEFSGYFLIAGNGGKRIFKAYPKFFFGCMIVFMSVSLILSFTVFRNHETPAVIPVKKVNPVEDGFSQIMQATGNIRETLHLKQLVDSLSSKKQLSPTDSVQLDTALDRLSKSIKH